MGFFRHIKYSGCISSALFLTLTAFVFSGCGEFFSNRPTEIQTEKYLRELSEINMMADVNNPVPKRYTQGPKIIQINGQFQVFYYTRNHTPANLHKLLTERLGLAASINDATNQLIITVPDEATGKAAVEYLNEIDVPPLQVRIDCMISEVFADVTLDYETQANITEIFGEDDISLISFLPGASVRSPTRGVDLVNGKPTGVGFKAGVDRDKFDAAIDVLESRGYAKILLNPKVVVVNNSTTIIETNERVPVQETIIGAGGVPVRTIRFEPVIDRLEVTPKIFGDGTIGLATNAQISSRTIPDGVDQAPIITTRTIKATENRLNKGESLFIGGIIKSERVSVIRGVPFLKDIPILGILFRSKDFEDSAREIFFVLTPSIVTQGVDYADTVQMINERHAKPEYKGGIEDILRDPFGIGAQTAQLEQEAAKAKFEKLKVEIKKAEAQRELELVREKMLETVEEVLTEKQRAIKASVEAEKSKKQAEQARTEAEQSKLQAEQARSEADVAKTEAELAKIEADQAKSLANVQGQAAAEAQAEAQIAKEIAAAQTETAIKAQQEAEKAKSLAEQARMEADKANAEKQAAEAAAKQAQDACEAAEGDNCTLDAQAPVDPAAVSESIPSQMPQAQVEPQTAPPQTQPVPADTVEAQAVEQPSTE